MASKRKKVTILTLYKMREEGVPISWLTCYDYPTALVMEQAGIDMILVGDSASMVVYGNESTLPIKMDTLIEHTKAVRKAAPSVYLVGDMPFMSYHISPADAVWNAGRFLKEAGCDAIKLEGGTRIADKVRAIVDAGIPVIGHIGLTPQSSAMLGGFRVQGTSVESAKLLLDDAKALVEAGVKGILLECVPTPVAQLIKRECDVLIFGIGAGPNLDGQLLIVHDLLGLFQAFQP
ncbi:MAG: 3-methyl-2-oxobutanoate hydroxymethyltransferase, partial [Planctomycetota bacterium]|nr:3-methyl-2-oxobutanoate hydroxymethyltransferase [Planctomycetota bacterium]